MLLSIGLIVKNESEHLPNCLKCLKPLLNAVESELIICDTGSTDDTVEIAEEYTENVIFREWDNDFAAARNFVIEAAKGEWYLSLDADEYFEDVTGIINFFQGSDHKRYNTATIEIRSYGPSGLYMASRNLRLTRNTPYSRYIGIVHELLPTILPLGHTTGYVRHLGYATEAISETKQDRNFPLIEKAHELDPKAINPIRYLAEHYTRIGEREKALELVDLGFKNLQPDDDMIYALYDVKVRAVIGSEYNKEYCAEALKVIEEFSEKLNANSFGGLMIVHQKATCLYYLDKFHEAADVFKENYAMVERLLKGNLSMDGAIVVFGGELASITGLSINAKAIALCYEDLNDFDSAFKWLDVIDPSYPGFVQKYSEVVVKTGSANKIEQFLVKMGRAKNIEESLKKASISILDGMKLLKKGDAAGATMKIRQGLIHEPGYAPLAKLVLEAFIGRN